MPEPVYQKKKVDEILENYVQGNPDITGKQAPQLTSLKIGDSYYFVENPPDNLATLNGDNHYRGKQYFEGDVYFGAGNTDKPVNGIVTDLTANEDVFNKLPSANAVKQVLNTKVPQIDFDSFKTETQTNLDSKISKQEFEEFKRVNEVAIIEKQDKKDESLETPTKFIVEAINFNHGSINTLDALKQDKEDNNLKTTDKTVVGAINEVFAEANGIDTVTPTDIGFDGDTKIALFHDGKMLTGQTSLDLSSQYLAKNRNGTLASLLLDNQGGTAIRLVSSALIGSELNFIEVKNSNGDDKRAYLNFDNIEDSPEELATKQWFGRDTVYNPSVPSGTTITPLTTIKKGDVYYSIPTGGGSGGGETATIPQASATVLGGVKVQANSSVGLNNDGSIDVKLAPVGGLTKISNGAIKALPATENNWGVIRAKPATDQETQEVKIDDRGFLKTKLAPEVKKYYRHYVVITPSAQDVSKTTCFNFESSYPDRITNKAQLIEALRSTARTHLLSFTKGFGSFPTIDYVTLTSISATTGTVITKFLGETFNIIAPVNQTDWTEYGSSVTEI